MTESPSLLLQRAADKLDELAASTTSGRWYVDHDSTGHIHADRPGCSPGYEPVVSDYTGECGVLNQADADWMAALSPTVAAPLANVLRYEARTNGSAHRGDLIALARLILGVSAEGKERSDP